MINLCIYCSGLWVKQDAHIPVFVFVLCFSCTVVTLDQGHICQCCCLLLSTSCQRRQPKLHLFLCYSVSAVLCLFCSLKVWVCCRFQETFYITKVFQILLLCFVFDCICLSPQTRVWYLSCIYFCLLYTSPSPRDS